MSGRLWDLDWSAELPWETNGARIAVGRADEVVSFLGDHHAELFPGVTTEERFLREPMTEAKRRWAAEMDVLTFRVGDELVGTLMGHPTDWSSYYIRTTAILPSARGRGLGAFVVDGLSDLLARVGVQRIEADVPATNTPSLTVLYARGFLVTSVLNSERWGSCLRLTKYLDPRAETAFVRQYCVLDARRRSPTHPLQKERSTP